VSLLYCEKVDKKYYATLLGNVEPINLAYKKLHFLYLMKKACKRIALNCLQRERKEHKSNDFVERSGSIPSFNTSISGHSETQKNNQQVDPNLNNAAKRVGITLCTFFAFIGSHEGYANTREDRTYSQNPC
jgi:hypothetical protein